MILFEIRICLSSEEREGRVDFMLDQRPNICKSLDSWAVSVIMQKPGSGSCRKALTNATGGGAGGTGRLVHGSAPRNIYFSSSS